MLLLTLTDSLNFSFPAVQDLLMAAGAFKQSAMANDIIAMAS